MKRLFLVFLLFLFTVFPSRVSGAQFSCTWDTESQNCKYLPDLDADRSTLCPPLSDPGQICEAKETKEDCDGAVNLACPPEVLSDNLCYDHISNAFPCCAVVNQGEGECAYPYSANGKAACEANCSGGIKRFSCKISCDSGPQSLCVEDSGGAFFDAEYCGANCKAFSGICCRPDKTVGISTAIGCVPTEDPEAFIGFFVRWALGLGAGITFLLIIYGGFQIMTAGGDAEKIKNGQGIISSAIAGLVLIVLSVFLVEIIGIDILKLPGLTK